MAKLVKTTPGSYKGKKYERYTLSIPPEVVKQLGWKDGIGLNLFASAGVLQIVPINGFVTKSN